MKFHRTYHPQSYSTQARALADQFLSWEDLDEAIVCLCHSYRCPMIRYRAIKRFIRKRKRLGK